MKLSATQKFMLWLTGGSYAEKIPYPPNPLLPPKPWFADRDALVTAGPVRPLPNSQRIIAHLAEQGELNVGTGSIKPYQGSVRGAYVNAARTSDPFYVIAERSGSRKDWVRTGYSGSTYGMSHRWSETYVVEGDPTPNEDRHLYILDNAERTLTEIQYHEINPALFGGGISSHNARVLKLNSASIEARGATAAKLPYSLHLLRHQDLMRDVDPFYKVDGMFLPKWRQRASIGVHNTGPSFLHPAFGSEGNDVFPADTHPDAIPMGTILVLRPEVFAELSRGAGPQARAVLECYATKGLIVVDRNGVGRHTTSLEPNARWDQDDLATLDELSIGDFVAYSLT